MQLTHDRAEGYFFIRAVRADCVLVADRELRSSVIVAPDRLVENWPPTRANDIDEAAMRSLVELEPEVVILGTGVRQHFPAQQLLLPLLRNGVGVEVMDNSAAARTYNLLAAEGRRVVAAFLLEPSTSI
ncbi:MAG: MTH938/NDUFAF3 family protein [Dokdonella sp.]|uniref:Mth938-like domain-containing protein n=1 Tax=Dokdonella sp. TaxID=2291710 RepID=UPI002BA24D1F|nr:MTH938/NDUFAF3 family protein [Dokdonella sp.]HOX72795.1 MTH938/NDUFAF3 family protein [Dokdonella sp.]HPG95455.1 MTH938/NDUFAF3 family protein [Dokdonella sp.]HPN80155.1 MTH938/NDUFAF3 family protein [Dokdonella sp.]